ncbi:uncharacterized protein E0L32_007211 [Thyridium curvatum]|uniref:Uncharacterized protein n=1 Tax=Thyridium curvatum TaxID=1093900 RepID=A0A507AZ74_9PEZI|nr:uncharacterized protein E0L32_007211 [Thyridium curvatum]TPX12096.1 hypothetical protein E0L32_007211 [Thyridium curvatum]
MVASNAIDYYHQTLENVRFFSPEHAEVCIVTAKDPMGMFKAVVMRAKGKTRTALLSETASSMPEALRRLHHKSAEAVHNHMTTYGCDFVRESKKRSKKGRTADSSDDESTVDDDSSSDSSEGGSIVSGFNFSKVGLKGAQSDDDAHDSDSSGDEGTSRAHDVRTGRAKARGRGIYSRSRSSSVDIVGQGEAMDNMIDRSALPTAPHFASGPNPMLRKPLSPLPPGGRMVPPPVWHDRMRQMASDAKMPTPPSSDVSPFTKFTPPNAPPMGMRHFPPTMPPLGPERAPPMLAPPPPPRDVKLHLIWPSYGEARVIEHCEPSRRVLEAVAARCVTEQKASFGMAAVPASSLRATLRHVQLGNERYSLSSFRGEDLSSLFDSAGGEKGSAMPLFEVEIERLSPFPMARPWMRNIEVINIDPSPKSSKAKSKKIDIVDN